MLVKACSLTLLTAGFGGMGDLVVVTTPLWPALSSNTVVAGYSGVRGAWGADVLVCVVVVVLVLLLRGCRWQRLGGFRGVRWCCYGDCRCRGGELRRRRL